MHCSHKTFHFLSVSDGSTSILSDIVMTLRKSHEIIFVWRIFEKPKILARDVFETSQRRHGKDIFFEICPRRLKDVTQKASFLKCFWDVLKAISFEMSLRGLWDISFNGDLIEISQGHLMPAGKRVFITADFKLESAKMFLRKFCWHGSNFRRKLQAFLEYTWRENDKNTPLPPLLSLKAKD